MKIKFEKLENGKIKITSKLGQVLELTEAEFKNFNYRAKKDKQRIKKANEQY